jgi:hypothetical protein
MLQDELALKYGYKKLPEKLSEEAREEYLNSLPSELDIYGNNNFNIYSKHKTLIATGYDRIVIGDYGAFIEIGIDKMILDNCKMKKGQEYRYFDEKYRDNVKYIWLTANDNSDIKIYFQKKTVVYADYKVDKFYVSPYEIIL